MKVVFIEVIRDCFKNSYKKLGEKEMDIVPIKGDVIQRKGEIWENWEVLLRRFVFDPEKGDCIKVFMRPYKL